MTVLAGFGLGYWLDGRLGTYPYLLLAGSGIGIAVAMVNLVVSVNRVGRSRTDRSQ